MSDNPVEIEIVIDRSGSMIRIADDAIGGFNTWLEAQKQVPGAANATVTLFDHEISVWPVEPLASLAPLTPQLYVPRGATALNDAVGRALSRLLSKSPDKAILVILTDGMENASREFTTEQIKALVEQAQAKGWQITYLSADINAFANAATIGINPADTIKFAATAAGTQSAYGATIARNTSYRNQ